MTNTCYTDGGLVLPPDRPVHIAVYACAWIGGTLAVATNGTILSAS